MFPKKVLKGKPVLFGIIEVKRPKNMAFQHTHSNPNFSILNFEAVFRKSIFGFIQQLAKITNILIMTTESSWIVSIDIRNFWQKQCTLLQQHEVFVTDVFV